MGDLSTFYTGINTTPKKLVSPTLSTKVANSTPATLSGMLAPKPVAAPVTTFVGGVPVSQTPPWTGSVGVAPPSAPVVATGPVAPASGPLFSGATGTTGGAPTGTTGPAPTGATGPTGSTVNPAYLNADGSFKTPAEIAAAVGSSLKSAHSGADIGTLAGEQFGPDGGNSADAEAAARRINNTRNDIAVGDADPYKTGSQSGIQYTPAELTAIEHAYAGVYDPALDSALAKVTRKQTEEKTAADAAASLAQIKAQGDQTRETQKNAPYTLGQNDVRYDGDGNPIAVGGGVGGGSGTYVAGQNPTVDAYVKGFQAGTYKASDIPDQYKALVAQGVAAASGASAPLSKTSTDALGIINQIFAAGQNADGTSNGVLGRLSGQGIIGAIEHPSSLFPGSDVQNVTNLAKQLQATLSLANRQQLKGQGAISDFEFKVLGDAATALGLDGNGRTNLSEDQFKKQLQNLQLKLQVGPTSLTDDEIQHLNSPEGGGFTPEQIRAYSASKSFNNVGNTTASTTGQNRPQRNNNPGNVKAGGLSDSLATGKDEQGHLIFPDAATGFKALTADLTAKINGGSAHLPANPTIAQLGSVYAEDPNWPKKVAAILGVPVETHTQTVPLANLVKAVATQEGFYA